MNTQAEIIASSRRRIIFAVAAAIMFALWGWSLVPPIQNWGNPNEDGFSYVGVFYATLICMPVGLFLLAGAMIGRGRSVRHARAAFYVAAAVTVIVAAFLIVQNIANNNDGKVFGILIGFRLDRPDVRRIRTHETRRQGTFAASLDSASFVQISLSGAAGLVPSG